MNVSLTEHLEQFVTEKVASGRYTSASEVVREALRLLEEQDRLRDLRTRQLEQELEAGIAELDRGRAKRSSARSIKAEGRRRKKAKKR